MRSSIVVFLSKSLRLLCAAALTCAIVPTLAFANTDSMQVFEEDVPFDQVAVQHAAASSPETVIAETEQTPTFFLAQMLETTHTVPMMTAELPLNATNDEHVSADRGASAVVGSFERDGVVYAFEPGGTSVAVVAVDPEKLPLSALETRDLALPSAVATDDEHTYPVSRIANYAFSSLASAAVMERGVSNGGAIVSIFIPSSVAKIGDNAFAGFDAFERIEVAEENPVYGAHDGCLYDAALSCLLLVPEGKQGAVLLPRNAEVVDASKFSHCSLVDAISVEEGSAAFSSVNDLLYDGSGATLLRIPAGATDIALSEKCERIEAGAAEGCTSLETIVAPNSQVEIAEGAFVSNDNENGMLDLGDITVILPAETTTSIWAQEGFQALVESLPSVIDQPSFSELSLELQERESSGVQETIWEGQFFTKFVCENENEDNGKTCSGAQWRITDQKWQTDDQNKDMSKLYDAEDICARWGYNEYAPFTLASSTTERAFHLGSQKVNGEQLRLHCEAVPKSGYFIKSIPTYQHVMIGGGRIFTLVVQLGLNEYDISYDFNGGKLPDNKGNPTKYDIETSDFTLNTPEREGYVFAGWDCAYANPMMTNGGATQFVPGKLYDAFTIKKGTYGALKLTAHWNPIEYELEYYSCDGGTYYGKHSGRIYGTVYKHTSNPGVPEGYAEAIGWSTQAYASTAEYAFGGDYSNLVKTVDANYPSTKPVVKFYLVGVPKEYRLTFDANGGLSGGWPGSFTVKYDSTDYWAYQVVPMPYRTGHAFGGWYTDPTGGDQVYDELGNGVEGRYWKAGPNGRTTWSFDTQADEINLYAHWIASPSWKLETIPSDAGFFRVSAYRFANGTLDTSIDYDSRLVTVGSFPALTCEGRADGFYQWRQPERAAPDDLEAGLYECGYAYAKDGYQFKGWRYMYEDATKELSGVVSWSKERLTQYAVFEGKLYEVFFDGNGGTSNDSSLQVKMGTSDYWSHGVRAYRSGYSFAGWYDSAEGGNQVWDSSGKAVEGKYWKKRNSENDSADLVWKYPDTITVYAHWIEGTSWQLSLSNADAAVIQVDRYKFNSGELTDTLVTSRRITGGNPPLSISGTADGRYSIEDSKADKDNDIPFFEEGHIVVNDGYDFIGWRLDDDEGTSLTCAKTWLAGEVSQYAVFKPKEYGLSLDATGGEVDEQSVWSPAEKVTMGESTNSTVPAAVRPGYTFQGWYTKPEGGEQIYATTESGNCTVLNEGTYWEDDKWRYPGDATFYAHWKANSFTIIFDANGVDAEMPEELEVEYDSEGVLSGASAEGYVFNGWDTESDGSGERYEEGDAFGTLTTEADAKITLYAQWVPALRISVPISVRLLVDASGVQEQEAGLGYIESRSISALKITNIEFAPLSEAADLFGSRVADVFLKVLSGAAASTDVIFALDANASEDDIDKLAPFALPAGIGARTNVEYRLDIPDAALADIDSDRFSEDPAQIGRVTYTAGLA